jgi:formylglycine-generating enzyme required for sulfatase activity
MRFRHDLGLPFSAAQELTPSWEVGVLDPARWARGQANLGIALLLLGRGEKVWPLLKDRTDPTLRSFLIEGLGPGGVEERQLTDQFEQLAISIRRAILLSLGQFATDRLPQTRRGYLLLEILKLYRDDPDSGIHGAAEWLLRKWGAEDKVRQIDTELAAGKAEGQRQWYVNQHGQTFNIISGAVEFSMGSPSTEIGRNPNENLHRRRIGRTVALASKEVTLQQYRRFHPEHRSDPNRIPEADCPVNVSWYQAAEYCNWLSKQEGVPDDQLCYVPNPAGKYAEGMKPAPNYLERTGYRLPTEAEWEYACRAGSETPWFFGNARELTGKYSWLFLNDGRPTTSHPVGRLKPNGLGFFDILGNAWEWCHDSFQQYAERGDKVAEDQGDPRVVTNALRRVLRGGSYATAPDIARSAVRFPNQPLAGDPNFLNRDSNVYFDLTVRPARTIH